MKGVKREEIEKESENMWFAKGLTLQDSGI